MAMAHDSANQEARVLYTQRRRFDGGNEIDLDRYLETRETLRITTTEELSRAKKPATKKEKILVALIQGPMELSVGIVGILTTLLAYIAFTCSKNRSLLDQSQTVFTDCLQMLWKGLGHTVIGPTKALKLAFQKAT